MPLIASTYRPSYFFRNGFISTVYSGLFRKVTGLIQERERIPLSDGDFLDLDWSYSATKTNRLIVLLHGLEGNAQRPYMTGAAKLFNKNEIDAVCVNFRSCSGEDNLKYRSYHSGATEDLKEVINHILATKTYTEIYLKGFSLGGNMVLKYLGEKENIPSQIKAGIAISVPCHLESSANELHRFTNVLFHNRFKAHLIEKLRLKQKQFPDKINPEVIKSVKTLRDFDNVYTSKAHGFTDAIDYYTQCSSLQFLPTIKTPTLLINALNDSFLATPCYPLNEAGKNSNLYLETPKYGGHVGFVDSKGLYYTEKRALEFIKSIA